MPLYMTQFSYTSEGWAALAKKPEDRSEAVGALAKALGGRLVNLYYHFGEYDGFIVTEGPDDITAGAAAIAAAVAGHLKAVKTTRLFTPQEAMEQMRKAGKVTLRPPG